MNSKIIYFTKEGYEKVEKDYEDLKNSRPEAVSELAKARAMGDLSENGYYKGARFKLSDIDRRLRFLKHQIQYGRIKQGSSDVVDIGSTVTLQNDEQTKIYSIVGTYEANPTEGKISPESPLGKLLMGKRRGDKITLQVGEKNITYTLLGLKS